MPGAKDPHLLLFALTPAYFLLLVQPQYCQPKICEKGGQKGGLCHHMLFDHLVGEMDVIHCKYAETAK